MLPIEAIVIDTDDPEQLDRVLVQSPEMGDYWPLWAPVVDGTAGTLGIDDLVVIAFLGGDATRPVVMGRLKRP
jgi:hypothetical protein